MKWFLYICIIMAKPTDFTQLIDKKINSLTILAEGEPHITSGGNKHRTAICRCDCGKIGFHQIGGILNNSVKSCGCYSANLSHIRCLTFRKTHGKTTTPEYNVWVSMRKRCFKENHKSYKYYGGRGIIVCDRWRNSFENFILDMGERPSLLHSLDRINNNGNYEPSNCKWSTDKEQTRNQRNNVLVTFNGETKCLAEWSEIYGLGWKCLHYRIFVAKWDLEKAFTFPKEERRYA